MVVVGVAQHGRPERLNFVSVSRVLANKTCSPSGSILSWNCQENIAAYHADGRVKERARLCCTPAEVHPSPGSRLGYLTLTVAILSAAQFIQDENLRMQHERRDESLQGRGAWRRLTGNMLYYSIARRTCTLDLELATHSNKDNV